MNTLLLAIDDGWTNGNYNWADAFFVIATALALLAAVGYLTPVRTTVDTSPPRRSFASYAAGLLALAVAAAAFAWFLL